MMLPLSSAQPVLRMAATYNRQTENIAATITECAARMSKKPVSEVAGTGTGGAPLIVWYPKLITMAEAGPR